MQFQKYILRLPPYTFTIATTIIATYLFLSQRPLADIDYSFFSGSDKIAHIIFMTGIMLILSIDYIRKKRHSVNKNRIPLHVSLSFFLITSLYGIIIELLQHLMQVGRNFDIYDLVANIIGSSIGLIIIYIFGGKMSHFITRPRH